MKLERLPVMVRLIVTLVLGLFLFVEAAPAFAQSGERFELAQQRRTRTLFDLLFGEEPAQPQPVPQQQQTQQAPQRRAPRAAAPTASLPPPKPEVVKAETATRLAVFGDSLAIDLSRALERLYAEDPNLAVINQGVNSSGFVRDDFFDWESAIDQQIAADSFDLAVVIIGINDRQALEADGTSLAPLTAPWTAAYSERVTTFLGKLRAARKPVIWIGLPPMSKSEYSAAISQISNIQRLASFSGGAEFLDIYDRFLGEDGRYSSYGPDVNGQNAQMRKDDGIHFATAGADKLAFYISQSVQAFYREGGSLVVAVADPLLGTDAAAMLRPPFQGLGQIRLLEVAGAVIPLSRAPQRAGDLLTASGSGARTTPFSLEQLVSAPVGRADAFGVGLDPAAQDEPVAAP